MSESLKNTNFVIARRRSYGNGCTMLTIRMINSDRPELLTNELPNILNSLALSGYLDAGTSSGFDYTLDFPMEGGFGFPYVLDFELEENVNIE